MSIGNQQIILLYHSLLNHPHYLLPDIAASRLSKKHPCFLEAIFPSLHKPRQACQEGRLEAWRTIGFEWYSFDVIRPGRQGKSRKDHRSIGKYKI